MLAEDKSGIDMHLSSAKNAPKKDSAVAKCAEFILKTLQAMHDTENINGMTWDSLITKAGLEGMKPKTMRLARTYLRSTAKLLVLYQCKSPGTRNMKYMWALASVPLPANAEVLDTYEEDTEEVYGFASLAAVVASARRTGGAQRLAVQVPAAANWDGNSAQAAVGFAWPAARGRLSDGNNHAAPTFSPDAAASRSCSGSLAHEGSMSSYPSPHAVASGHGQALSDTAGDDTCGRSLDGANNRVGGGVGQRLKYEDLQAQFGFGLGEAAANLGVCKTTLKRACRSHGIRRWPRKQIAKLSKALSTVSKHGLVPAQIGQVVKEPEPAVMQQQGHSLHQANLPAVSQTQVLAALEPPGQLLAKPMQQQQAQMPQVEKQQQQQVLGSLASVLLSEQQSREAMHLLSPRDVAMPAATKADLPGTLLSFMLQQQRQNPQPLQHQAAYSMMPRAAPAVQQGLLCHQLSLMQRHTPQLQSGSYSLDMGPVYLDGLPFNAMPSAAVVPAGYSQAGLRQSLAYNVRAHMGAPMNVVACPPYSVIILG